MPASYFTGAMDPILKFGSINKHFTLFNCPIANNPNLPADPPVQPTIHLHINPNPPTL